MTRASYPRSAGVRHQGLIAFCCVGYPQLLAVSSPPVTALPNGGQACGEMPRDVALRSRSAAV